MAKKIPVGTINVTPTWESLHGLYSDWIDSGTPSQKALVKKELLKLCKAVDKENERKKREDEAWFEPLNPE